MMIVKYLQDCINYDDEDTSVITVKNTVTCYHQDKRQQDDDESDIKPIELRNKETSDVRRKDIFDV